MYEDKLDIQIAVETETPDVVIEIEEETPEIEIMVESGGEGREIYSGEYEVEPKFFEDTVLQTKDKIMARNVTVNEIRIEKVSSPTGGYVYYIGT